MMFEPYCMQLVRFGFKRKTRTDPVTGRKCKYKLNSFNLDASDQNIDCLYLSNTIVQA
jgi:hypothetical protein